MSWLCCTPRYAHAMRNRQFTRNSIRSIYPRENVMKSFLLHVNRRPWFSLSFMALISTLSLFLFSLPRGINQVGRRGKVLRLLWVERERETSVTDYSSCKIFGLQRVFIGSDWFDRVSRKRERVSEREKEREREKPLARFAWQLIPRVRAQEGKWLDWLGVSVTCKKEDYSGDVAMLTRFLVESNGIFLVLVYQIHVRTF